MKLWKNPTTLEQLNAICYKTIHTPLGIRYVKIGNDFLEATMPVDERTWQPAGLLHGGASLVLAESLGSIASYLVVGTQDKICLGIEINASHLNSIQRGEVIGHVSPIRIGQTLHVWNIVIRDAHALEEKIICQSRLTVMIRDRPSTSSVKH